MRLKLFHTKHWQPIIYFLFFFSIFHLIRDILQIEHIDNLLSASLHTSRTWCNPICDYITIPPEIFIILASPFILLKNRFGLLGKIVIVVFVVWLSAWTWSYITR